MIKYSVFFISMMFMITTRVSYGQQDPQSSLYMFNPLMYNAGYAGSRGSVSALGAFRYQWIGYEGAPKTGYLSFHMPVKRQNIGLGFNMVNDNIGAWNNLSWYATFAYSLRLNKKNTRLSIGMNGGADYYQAYFSDLRVNDMNDANLAPVNRVVPNFGLGIYMHGERFYVGASLPRILEMNLNPGNIVQSTVSKVNRHYFIMAGYVFSLNSAVDFKPSFLVKMTENAPITFDINASFMFYKKFWIGGYYRYHESGGINMMFLINQKFYIGYAYDLPFNNLFRYQYGTHEIVLGIDLKPHKKAVLSPRYF